MHWLLGRWVIVLQGNGGVCVMQNSSISCACAWLCIGYWGVGSLVCREMTGCIYIYNIYNDAEQQKLLSLWLIMHCLLGRWFIVFQGNGWVCIKQNSSIACACGWLCIRWLTGLQGNGWVCIMQNSSIACACGWLCIRWGTVLQENGGVYVRNAE